MKLKELISRLQKIEKNNRNIDVVYEIQTEDIPKKDFNYAAQFLHIDNVEIVKEFKNENSSRRTRLVSLQLKGDN